MRRAICCVMLVWLACAGVSALGQEPGRDGDEKVSPEFKKKIDALLVLLKHCSLENKDEAQQKIVDLGEEALPYLEQVAKDTNDPEVRFLIGIMKPAPRYDEFGNPIEGDSALSGPRTFTEISAEQMELIAIDDLPEVGEDVRDRYIERKFLEAKVVFQRGNYEYARQLVEALLVVEPENPFREEMRKFKIMCEELSFRDAFVKPTVTVSRTACDFGDVLEFVFRMQNVSREDVLIPAFVADAKDKKKPHPTVTSIKIELMAYDYMGNVTTEVQEKHFVIEQDIKLAPGDVWEQSIQFDTADGQDNLRVLRKLSVSAFIRPPEVETAEGQYTRKIEFPQATAKVFPIYLDRNGQGFSLLRFVRKNEQKPVEVLKDALYESSRPETVFLSAMALRRTEAVEAVGVLMESLSSKDVADDNKGAALTALHHLTGRTLEFKIEKWQEWWEKNRADFNVHMVPDDF